MDGSVSRNNFPTSCKYTQKKKSSYKITIFTEGAMFTTYFKPVQPPKGHEHFSVLTQTHILTTGCETNSKRPYKVLQTAIATRDWIEPEGMYFYDCLTLNRTPQHNFVGHPGILNTIYSHEN